MPDLNGEDLDRAFYRMVSRLGVPERQVPLARACFDSGAIAGANNVLHMTAQLGDTIDVMRRLVALLEERPYADTRTA